MDYCDGGGVPFLVSMVPLHVAAVVSLLDPVVAQRALGLRSWLIPVRALPVQVAGWLAGEHSLTVVTGPALLSFPHHLLLMVCVIIAPVEH